MKIFIYCLLILMLSNCKFADFNGNGFPELNLDSSPYWTKVLSIGPKLDSSFQPVSEYGYLAEQCQGTQHCIALSWTPFIASERGMAEGYAVYRKAKEQMVTLNILEVLHQMNIQILMIYERELFIYIVFFQYLMMVECLQINCI